MSETISAPVTAPTMKKKWNVWVITGALLAVTLTGVGLGIGLSQFSTTSTPASQQAGFVKVSGPSEATDTKSFVSGSIAFPATYPLQVGDEDGKWSAYQADGLTPKPAYSVGSSSASGSNFAAGTDLTDNPRLLTRMRAGETILATYSVVDKATNAPMYSFVVTYVVQPHAIDNPNESLYNDVSFRFATDAERLQATLPVISVLSKFGGPDTYLTPTYRDQSNKDITTNEQLRSLPVGSTFSATYVDSHTDPATNVTTTNKFVVTYVISVG